VSLVLLLAAAGLLTMPGMGRSLLTQLPAAERAKLQLLVLLSGITSLGLGLALCAAPVVYDLVGLRPIGLVGAQHFFPGGSVAGWASLAVLLVLIAVGFAAAVGHIRTQVRLRTETAFADEIEVGGISVWALPTDLPFAFALPVGRGKIVVSQGVIERLDPAQLSAVVRHELSHLTHNHHWYLLVADLVERVFSVIPAISRSTSSLRLAVEQWADDDSILVPADRLIISAAMRYLVGLPAGPTVAAYAREDLVASRLHYLEREAKVPTLFTRVPIYVAIVAGLTGAIGSLIVWAS
jgi:Zn-dependent protease with chaperone function